MTSTEMDNRWNEAEKGWRLVAVGLVLLLTVWAVLLFPVAIIFPIAALTIVAFRRSQRKTLSAERSRAAAPQERSRWRLVPLGSAIVLIVLIAVTLGAGIILTPIATALTVVALRRTRPESHVDFAALVVGVTIIATSTFFFLWTIWLIAYDQLI